MNITISINKDFGELTDKKINRLTSNFDELINTQNIDSQIAVFQFEDHILVLNKPNNEIAFSFGTLDNLDRIFGNMSKLLELLDLDNIGKNNIIIEDIQEASFSVAKASKKKLGINDESDGVGLRFLIDTFTSTPKEIRVEPRIDDFNKIYIYCSQSQNEEIKLTKEFIKETIEYLLVKSEQYKRMYLEKGGIVG